MKMFLALILSILVFLGTALPVSAAQPSLEINARGRGFESAGAWGTITDAKVGDTYWLWIIVKNSVFGTTANNVRVKLDLPTGESNILVIKVHAKADNAPEVTQDISVNLLQDFKSDIKYLPGNAEVITSLTAVHNKVDPDNETANLTTQEVSLGNVIGGEYSYAHILATVSIGNRTAPLPTGTIKPTIKPTITTTITPTITPANATSSAVSKTTPDTGANEVIWPTLMWIVVGFSGYSIRQWAHQKSG